MAVIQTEIKALHLRHPELDVPAVAEVRGKFIENGRWNGQRLRFQGEHHDRCLRFGEIRQLMEMDGELC